MREARLEVQRERVVDSMSDATGLEVGLELVPAVGAVGSGLLGLVRRG